MVPFTFISQCDSVLALHSHWCPPHWRPSHWCRELAFDDFFEGLQFLTDTNICTIAYQSELHCHDAFGSAPLLFISKSESFAAMSSISASVCAEISAYSRSMTFSNVSKPFGRASTCASSVSVSDAPTAVSGGPLALNDGEHADDERLCVADESWVLGAFDFGDGCGEAGAWTATTGHMREQYGSYLWM